MLSQPSVSDRQRAAWQAHQVEAARDALHLALDAQWPRESYSISFLDYGGWRENLPPRLLWVVDKGCLCHCSGGL